MNKREHETMNSACSQLKELIEELLKKVSELQEAIPQAVTPEEQYTQMDLLQKYVILSNYISGVNDGIRSIQDGSITDILETNKKLLNLIRENNTTPSYVG